MRKSYGPVKVVDGASFMVDQEEAFGLLEPSGASKTTIEILEGYGTPDDC